MNQKKAKEKLLQETYNLYYRLTNLLPNPDTILRKIGRGIEVYRELKNDAHVWSCIQSRKSGVLSLEWNIEQGKSSGEVFEMVRSVFERLDVYQIESDILEAPLFGFQPIEIIWGQDGKYLLPRELKARPQEWFGFDIDGNLIYKGKFGNETEEIPEYKIILVQHEATAINPYGHSLLAKCYWPVTFKNGGLRFWVNFTERYGMPILIGQYQRGATNEEIRQLASDLDSIYEDAILVAPMDVKLELHEPNRSSSVELYLELIRFANNEISKAILSQTLTTELEGGSYAASQTHFQIRKEIIMADTRLVQNAMNQLIRYIVDLNFGASEYPKFVIDLH
ncbi:DUF935 family protein [Bacteroidetes/Chlorobi group bacterium Naka2016]|jgi:phage gp29-like protein|nr:MAG: DUF935 family protein [Bacteroidetes/Chlorobi group bacterium Naka2016]